MKRPWPKSNESDGPAAPWVARVRSATPKADATKVIRSGFTLVELLLVIAIVAILAALLLPALSGGKDKSKALNCIENLHQWGMEWSMYCGDNKEFFPTGQNADGSIDQRARCAWFTALTRNHTTPAQLLTCPLATAPNADPAITFGGLTTCYVMPADGDNEDADESGQLASYTANLFIYNAKSDMQGRPQAAHWAKLGAPALPAKVPLMADGLWCGGGPYYLAGDRKTGTFQPAPQPGIETQASLGGDENAEMEHFCVPRHGLGKRTQMVYFDGSAASIKCRDLWAQLWNRNWDPDYVSTNYPLVSTCPSSFWPAWIRNE